MKRISIDTQIRRIAARAIAKDKTLLQLKDNVEILKIICMENTGRIDVLERKVDILTERVDALTYKVEVLSTNVSFLVEGVTELIRNDKESKQLLNKIIPLAEEGEGLKIVMKDHISNRKVHVNMN